MTMPVLEVQDLTVGLTGKVNAGPIVEGLNFAIDAGKCLGVVGESGSGKSTVALAVMGLLEAATLTAQGKVRLQGDDLLALRPADLRARQGRDIAMIFQDPSSSLNPVQRIGDQIVESLRAHQALSRTKAEAQAIAALTRVGMPDPAGMMRRYPHQLSGGQRQRVMIAMAVILKPRLLVADEPTTALDLTIQAQILVLLKGLVAETGMALLIISHDLGVVAELADEVIVLYAGRAVERGPTARVLDHPRHPYTIGLIAAHPRTETRGQRLTPISGAPPALMRRPKGCAFHPRCALATADCATLHPATITLTDGQAAACLHLDLTADGMHHEPA